MVGRMNTTLLALAFGGLLQSSPFAAHQAAAPGSQAATAPKQETKPDTEGNLATIIQSGSTNTRAYNVVIHNDGSATAVTIGATHAMVARQEFPPGKIDTKTLRRLLTAIGDVSKITTGNCAKSASFGTRTQISFAGKTSGDLQCVHWQVSGGDQSLLQASEDLARFVQTTLNQLKIDDRRVSPNQ